MRIRAIAYYSEIMCVLLLFNIIDFLYYIYIDRNNTQSTCVTIKVYDNV